MPRVKIVSESNVTHQVIAELFSPLLNSLFEDNYELYRAAFVLKKDLLSVRIARGKSLIMILIVINYYCN